MDTESTPTEELPEEEKTGYIAPEDIPVDSVERAEEVLEQNDITDAPEGLEEALAFAILSAEAETRLSSDAFAPKPKVSIWRRLRWRWKKHSSDKS